MEREDTPKQLKYAVIGDAGSMHIYSFVRTVLLPRGYEIHLITLSAGPVREMYRQFYAENGITVHSIYEKGLPGLNKKTRFHRGLQLLYKVMLMWSLPRVDVCHVHSVYKTAMWLIRLFPYKYKKLILSYWGSDVEREPDSTNRLREKSFPRAGCITFTIERSLDIFRGLYGDRYDDKLVVCRFATEGLEHIRRLAREKSRAECRAQFNIPEGKICVTCGYNASPAQFQDVCLRQIAQLPASVRERIHVVVPMQYAHESEAYDRRVRQAAAECGASYDILEEFVPYEISAMLAIATDIYIHVRATDAFSNALKEQVYAGSDIIKGSWLEYRELDRMDARVQTVSTSEQLRQALEQLLADYVPKREIELFEPMYELYSSASTREQWNAVIDKTMKDE